MYVYRKIINHIYVGVRIKSVFAVRAEGGMGLGGGRKVTDMSTTV